MLFSTKDVWKGKDPRPSEVFYRHITMSRPWHTKIIDGDMRTSKLIVEYIPIATIIGLLSVAYMLNELTIQS